MDLERILDAVLVPRPGASPALREVGAFLAGALEEAGASVHLQPFSSTPHGLALAWSAALLLLAGYVGAVAARRFGLALVLALVVPALLLAEFEFQLSPVSGFLPAIEHNVIGSFAAAPGAPRLVFTAHYDTTTHLGDHLDWGFWAALQGPATALALGLALSGLLLRRRGRQLPRWVSVPLACLAAVPFAAFFVFQTLGPLVREPSPGAVDNGGSVAALVLLADALAERPARAAVGVEIAFLAAEEERTLGSRAHAQSLLAGPPAAVVNLESIGASRDLALVVEDGFGLRRFRSPEAVVGFVRRAGRRLGLSLPERRLPFGTLTDGRSYLAAGLPAVTIRAFTGASFPRRLHSARDARERLDPDAIRLAARLLRAIVAEADRDPAAFAALARNSRKPDPNTED